LLAEEVFEPKLVRLARELCMDASERYVDAMADRSLFVGRFLVVLISLVTRISRSRLTLLSSSSSRWICLRSLRNASSEEMYADHPCVSMCVLPSRCDSGLSISAAERGPSNAACLTDRRMG
jgi:hypothetical protein